MSDLFRSEAVEHQRQRLYGDVIIEAGRISKVSVVAIGVISLTLIGWALLAEYSRTETVPGIVTTTQATTKVYAQRAGTIKKLHVSEGESVGYGQVLATVSVDVSSRNGQFVAGSGLAELDNQRLLLQREIANTKRAFTEEKERIADLVRQNTLESRSLQAQIAIQKEIAASAEDIFTRFGSVIAVGAVSRNDYEALHRDVLQSRQRLAQLEQEEMKAAGQLSQYRAQLLKTVTDNRKQMGDLEVRLSALAQQRLKLQGDVDYQILSPTKGRVSSLQAADGRAVDARLPILTVLPQDLTFQAELFAPSRSVGFVREGQQVRIMYDAFPYQRFGSFAGQIETISHSIASPSELDVPIKLEEPVYRVRVGLATQNVPANGSSFPLQSGMTLKANIILEKRSFFDWLLAPFNAVRRRST